MRQMSHRWDRWATDEPHRSQRWDRWATYEPQMSHRWATDETDKPQMRQIKHRWSYSTLYLYTNSITTHEKRTGGFKRQVITHGQCTLTLYVTCPRGWLIHLDTAYSVTAPPACGTFLAGTPGSYLSRSARCRLDKCLHKEEFLAR